jgi:hypothetical protein
VACEWEGAVFGVPALDRLISYESRIHLCGL